MQLGITSVIAAIKLHSKSQLIDVKQKGVVTLSSLNLSAKGLFKKHFFIKRQKCKLLRENYLKHIFKKESEKIIFSKKFENLKTCIDTF